jgi:hypothetical protein
MHPRCDGPAEVGVRGKVPARENAGIESKNADAFFSWLGADAPHRVEELQCIPFFSPKF